MAVAGEGAPEAVGGARVTARLFELLGVAPALGREISPDEDRAGGPAVAVLSDRLWRRRFGGDRDVLGQEIRIDGVPHVVVGVMPPDFRFPEDVWIALAPHAVAGDRADRSLGVAVRLAAGVDLDRANAEIGALAARIAAAHPVTQRAWTARVTPLRDDIQAEPQGYFWTQLGAGAFVVLVVCANVAGLVVARLPGRHRELAIRALAGASRARIARQLFHRVAGRRRGRSRARAARGRVGHRPDPRVHRHEHPLLDPLRHGRPRRGLLHRRLPRERRRVRTGAGAGRGAGHRRTQPDPGRAVPDGPPVRR